MSDKHSSFIKTPKQLAIVVVVAFLVPIALIVLLSQLVTGVMPSGSSEGDNKVLTRIQPFGRVTLADASAPSGNQSGEQVYQAVCKTCHEPGLAGAPKVGDRAAWAPAIKKGYDTLVQHAINGFQMKGVALSNYAGLSVSSAGDVNGDGLADLIVGAYGAGPSGTGTCSTARGGTPFATPGLTA